MCATLGTMSQKPLRKAWIWARMAVVMRCSATRSTYSRLLPSVTCAQQHARHSATTATAGALAGTLGPLRSWQLHCQSSKTGPASLQQNTESCPTCA